MKNNFKELTREELLKIVTATAKEFNPGDYLIHDSSFNMIRKEEVLDKIKATGKFDILDKYMEFPEDAKLIEIGLNYWKYAIEDGSEIAVVTKDKNKYYYDVE